jgi:hypothetical protein
MGTRSDGKKVINELQLQSYIKGLNRFSFVSLRLYIIQSHISKPIGQHMTSPPPPHFVTFFAFLRPSSDIFPLPNDCTDLTAHTVTCVSASPTRVLTWDRLLEDSPRVSSSLPDCVCVCVCVCVCLPPRGHIFRTFPSLLCTWSVFAIHMGPSSVTFSPRFVVSAHSRVCSSVSQPPPGYIFQTFPSSLLQHIPSHTSALSPTHTSAHAFTVTIMKFLFLISGNNAVHHVARLVIPGNAGHPS